MRNWGVIIEEDCWGRRKGRTLGYKRGKLPGKRGDSKVVEVGGREERISGLQLRRIGGGEGRTPGPQSN